MTIMLICFIPHVSYSQQNPYQFYNIDKIRSNEVIKGIIKDEKGFVWLATDQGVLRYDGRETTIFQKGLPSPFAKKFLKRRNGRLLVLTDFGVREIINQDDTTFFRPIQVNNQPFLQPLNYPKSAFEDKDGNLWIGEYNAVVRISDKGIKRYQLGPEYQSINYHRSFAFAEDAFDNLWIAAYNGKLVKYNKEEDLLEEADLELPITNITCIFTVHGDNIWMGGKEGIYKFKIGSDQSITETAFINGPKNISTGFIIDHEVYIGTWDNGLFHTGSRALPYQFTSVEGLPFDDILDFYYDKQQQEIWITGSENIGLLKPAVIKTIGKAGKSRIESMTLDMYNNLYFSTGQQIFKLPAELNEEAQQIYASKSTYIDRLIWDGQKLWMGEAFGGISYLDLTDNTVHILRGDTTNAIQYILKDSKGNKWFTGYPQGLIRVSGPDEIMMYSEVKESAVIKESDDGRIFCGAHGKDSLLYVYNEAGNEFALLQLQFNFQASSDIHVEDIAFDSLGNAWLATNEGLLKLKKEGDINIVERMDVKGLDIKEPYKAIAIYNGNIWLAYANGLVAYHQGLAIFYTPENGLPSRLLKERGLLIHNHNLFIATAKGLARIDLRHTAFQPTSRPIIRALMVNGKKYPIFQEKDNIFSYGSHVQAEYASLSYPGNNLLYQTRISGLDKNWSEPSSNNSISVLGFTEGDYTLEIRARDDGHVWSDPQQLIFTISSPWYKSWWALLLLLLSGVLLIVMAAKLYHLNLIRQKNKLKRIIEDRTKEINLQKNEIIEQQNEIIQQKEELIEKNTAVFNTQKALSEADLNYLHLKKKQLDDQIEYRNKQITTHTLKIIQKNEMLKDLWGDLEAIINSPEGISQKELKKLQKIIDESFRHDKDWDEFQIYFEQVFTGFYAKLKVNFPDLSNQELRHCALIRLNLRTAECASVLGISPGSIKVSRNRLKKKLNLQAPDSLMDFLISI